LSTFTTSLLLRYREGVLKGVHRALPNRLARVLVLYESWWQQLRDSSAPTSSGIRRIIVGLIIDLVVVAVVILSWEAWRQEVGQFLTRAFSLGDELGDTLTVLALVLALLPLLVPLVFGARAVALRLSASLFVGQYGSSQALLSTAIGILIVAVFGIPGTFLLGRAVGTVYVWPAFLLALLLSGWVLWRRIGSLDSEMRSGGLLMLKAVAEQGFTEVSVDHHPTLPGLPSLLPVKLAGSHFAVGKSLAEIDLRATTGASVVALTTPQGGSAIPTGAETLSEGAVLYLTGSAAAQRAARELLISGIKPPPQDEADQDEANDA